MALIKSQKSFIGDFSIDRTWPEFKKALDEAGYDIFLISLDLQRDHLARMYQAKGYHRSLLELDRLVAEHEAFLRAYGAMVGCSITTATFAVRLERSLGAVRAWLDQR